MLREKERKERKGEIARGREVYTERGRRKKESERWEEREREKWDRG